MAKKNSEKKGLGMPPLAHTIRPYQPMSTQ